MIEYGLVALYAVAGSFMFRFRGGLFGETLKKIPGWGTLTTRLVWSLFMALPAFYVSVGVPYVAIASLIVAWYVGIAPGWQSSQYMQDGLNSLLLLSLRGLWLVFPAAIVYHAFYTTNLIPILIAGMLQGPTYYLAQKLFRDKYGIGGANEMAEWMYGFVLSLGLGLSIIL